MRSALMLLALLWSNLKCLMLGWFGGYSLRHQIVMAAREAIRNPGVAAGGGVIRDTLVFACHYYVYHGSNMLADVY